MSKFYSKKTYMKNKTSCQLTYFCPFHHTSSILLVKSKSSMHLLVKNLLVTTFHSLATCTNKLSKHDEVYAYNTYLLGHLHHLIATTCIKTDWRLMKKLYPKMCFIFPLNSHFPCLFLKLSYSKGGINLTSFFNRQRIKN